MHEKGMFYSIGITAFYRVQHSPRFGDNAMAFRNRVYAACASVMLQTPNLSATVLDGCSSNPLYIHMDEIDLENCISIDENNPEDLDAFLENQHNVPFPPKSPMWRLHVFGIADRQNSIEFTATFFFHHALGDGISGVLFHRRFAAALTNQTQNGEIFSSIKAAGNKLRSAYSPLPLPFDELHPLPLTILYTLKMVYQHVRSSGGKSGLWTGNKVTMPLVARYKSFQLPHSKAADIIEVCKMHNTTVTALLQELVSFALFLLLPPDYTTLRSAVAVSTRPWLGEARNNDPMGLFVTSTFKTHSRMQNANPNVRPSFNWTEASLSTQHLQSFLKTNGKNNWIGLMRRYMKNIPAFLESRVGKPRSLSFEISNLGSFNGETHNPDEGIRRMVFSQTISAVDSAIQVSVITARTLSIGISWQEGIVPQRQITSLIDIMKSFLDNIKMHT